MRYAICFKKDPAVLERFGSHEGEKIFGATMVDLFEVNVSGGNSIYELVLESGPIGYFRNKLDCRNRATIMRLD